MTIEELIEKLKEYPSETVVMVTSEHCCGCSCDEVADIEVMDNGKIFLAT